MGSVAVNGLIEPRLRVKILPLGVFPGGASCIPHGVMRHGIRLMINRPLVWGQFVPYIESAARIGPVAIPNVPPDGSRV